MKKILFISLILSTYVYSQELNCNVIVNYQNLPVNNRELLADFGNVVQNYMNSTQFTNETWEGDKIDCTLNIFFTSASSDIDYAAQIVVVSQRPVYKSTKNSPILTINDAAWNFQYEVGRSMYSNTNVFDPLTSLLDFYGLIIIGFDMDTWGVLGGTPYFKKAFDIVNLAASSNFTNGWLSSSTAYNRYGLVSNLLDEKYAAFRAAIFDYHYGVDIYAQNKSVGQSKIVEVVNVLYDMYESQGIIKSVLVKVFFDAKNAEITDLLAGYPEVVTIVNKLKKIDPSHAGKYNTLAP